MRPIEQIAEVRFFQQIGGMMTFRYPWAEPASGPDAERFELFQRSRDHLALFTFGHVSLSFGVGYPMSSNVIAPLHTSLGKVRTLINQSAVNQRRCPEFQPIEEFHEAPRSDTISVIAPCVIHHVRFCLRRSELRTQTLTEGEYFVVDTQINRQPFAIGP